VGNGGGHGIAWIETRRAFGAAIFNCPSRPRPPRAVEMLCLLSEHGDSGHTIEAGKRPTRQLRCFITSVMNARTPQTGKEQGKDW
jgi:hypothetical protein